MRPRHILSLILVIFVLGCPARRPATVELPDEAIHPDAYLEVCPTDLEGVRVLAADIDGGVALIFTGPEEHVAEVRKRTRTMATLYLNHTAAVQHRIGPRPFMRRRPSPQPEHPPILAELVAADARPHDIRGGARLELRSVDPRLVRALREQERQFAERMNAGECPIGVLVPLVGTG